jgi:RHS repeat-associated protein
VLVTVSDKKLGVDANSDGIIDYYTADVITANDYYPFGSQMPGRKYSQPNSSYRYGFNGKEIDNNTGEGNLDFGARIYDGRLGRFLSVDPITSEFPWQSPYAYAANNPISLIDVDGMGPRDPKLDDILNLKLQIDMSSATPLNGQRTQLGAPRNFRYFWKQMLKVHGEMFSKSNEQRIKSGKAPYVDAQWIIFNPQHKSVLRQAKRNRLLEHHHIDQGNMATAIPRSMHDKYDKLLHPYKNGMAVPETQTVPASSEVPITAVASKTTTGQATNFMPSEGQGLAGSFNYSLLTNMETSSNSTSLSLSGSIKMSGGKDGYSAVTSIDILVNGKLINDPGLNLQQPNSNVTQMTDADKIYLGSIDLHNIPASGSLEVVFKITTVHRDAGNGSAANNTSIKVKLR